MNVTWVVWTVIGGKETQTLLATKKIEHYALSGRGDTKTVIFPSSLTLALSLLLVLVLAPHYEPPGEIFTA